MAMQVAVVVYTLAVVVWSTADPNLSTKPSRREVQIQMKFSDNERDLRKHLETFLASLPLPGRDLTSAEAENGQRSKRAILEGKANSVPVLLDSLGNPDFVIKDTCYDLVLEIGSPAKELLYGELGKRDPIVDIWIVAMLKHLGDERAMDRLWQMLDDPGSHVRHLSALAIAFHHLDSATPHEQLFPVLVDALGSEENIERTPFSLCSRFHHQGLGGRATQNPPTCRSMAGPPKKLNVYK